MPIKKIDIYAFQKANDMLIKEFIKRFVWLFTIGQFFLIGAVFDNNNENNLRQTFKESLNNITTFALNKQKSNFSTSTTLELETKKSNKVDYATYELASNCASIAKCISSFGDTNLRNTNKLSEKEAQKYVELDKDKLIKPVEVEILGITHKTFDPYDIIEFEIASEPQIQKITHNGKLLRIRIFPALSKIKDEVEKELNGIFQKFTQYKSNKYTELVFYAGGNIGEPYLVRSSSNSYTLNIPFFSNDAKDPLRNSNEVSKGVYYLKDRVKTGAGFSDVYILKVSSSESGVTILPVLANEGIAQKEVLSSIARRYEADAAVNGCYFTQEGEPIGTLIIGRKLVSSPYGKRSVFGITTTGKYLFGNPEFRGYLHIGNKVIEIDAVNQVLKKNQLVIYTPEYARSTKTTSSSKELVLIKGKVVGIHKNNSIIPPDGVVISASGEKAELLENVRLGESIRIEYKITPPWNTVLHAVCGGPRLIAEGVIDIRGQEESFQPYLIRGRHPRTAVAQTFGGDLIFVVVDGRSNISSGMTLAELAEYLKKLGARHAINLDGGGSSTMIIKGRVVNKPSDGRERPISNGIVVKSAQIK